MFSKNASGKATSNTVSGAGKHGVLVTDHCGSVALSSNKISNSKQNGVCVSNYSSSVSVNSNSISGSGKSGISVSSRSKASLKDNAVNGSKSAAVSKSADSSISLPRVSGLSVNSVNNTDIQISFSGRSTNKCGYEIYRKQAQRENILPWGRLQKESLQMDFSRRTQIIITKYAVMKLCQARGYTVDIPLR